MSYGFNPDELIDTKVELIDKDGFHKVGEAADNGGSSIEPDSNGMFFKEGLNIWIANMGERFSENGADVYEIVPQLMSSVILKVKPSGVNDIDRGVVAGLYMYAGNAIDDDDIEIDAEMASPFHKSTNESIGTTLWPFVLSTGGNIQKDGYAMNTGCLSRNDISAEFIETYSGAQVHVIAACYDGGFVQFHNVQFPEISDAIHD